MTELLNLEKLRETFDFLVNSMSSYMADCAIMSFHNQRHAPSVKMVVETNTQFHEFSVTWRTDITQHLLGATADKERTTEWGAMGIALLLVNQLTEYRYIRASARGTGIDFYLSTKSDEIT